MKVLRLFTFLFYGLIANTTFAQLDTSFGVEGVFESEFISSPSHPPRFVQANNGNYYTFGFISLRGPFIYKLDSNAKESTRFIYNMFFLEGANPNENLQVRDIASINNRVFATFNEFRKQPNAINYEGVVQCFDENLKVDSSFGNNGFYVLESDSSNDFFLENIYPFEGGLLLSGGVNIKTDTSQKGVVLKLKLNGTLDSTFGLNGKVEYAIANVENTRKVLPVQQGFMLVRNIDSIFTSTVTKYKLIGSVDSSFGNNGSYSFSNANFNRPLIQELKELSNGKIVLAGQLRLNASSYKTLVIRLNANGKEDLSFGVNGVVLIDDFSNVVSEEVIGIVSIDSSIVLGLNGSGSYRYIAAISLKQDGSINDGFVRSGLLFDPEHNASLVRLDRQNRLVFLGISKKNAFLFARYLPNSIREASVLENLDLALPKVYPNPSNGLIKVESELPIKRYELLDYSGRLLRDQDIINSSTHLELKITEIKGNCLLKLFDKEGVLISSQRISLY